MKNFNFTQEEIDRLLYLRKWFPKYQVICLPSWSARHGDSKSYLDLELNGEENERFRTTIRTCGRTSEESYQNVTLMEKTTKVALARMDTGSKAHFDKKTMTCINGPHVHIYDAGSSERAYTTDELLGYHENTARYIEAFWKHFNIDTENISITGDLFNESDNR